MLSTFEKIRTVDGMNGTLCKRGKSSAYDFDKREIDRETGTDFLNKEKHERDNRHAKKKKKKGNWDMKMRAERGTVNKKISQETPFA